ncbi:uncharacterized protein CC84DRAFT_587158 [Paraphaeosphaeria sporulosa]|uniref:Uncharacterized protein n=1 Tax=Paraphaeosphaeria sporulosa TaxID=1460663 RepID=A0A177CPS2_9PLEO|nr:uncharacterized protein CC84DRAFT_587158 [Paraphaeosphaeria sporulosa]OAG08757.1 hypothetical protein CC84DRAFT_587158 [Paraphaeosphaeria sporulosa]
MGCGNGVGTGRKGRHRCRGRRWRRGATLGWPLGLSSAVCTLRFGHGRGFWPASEGPSRTRVALSPWAPRLLGARSSTGLLHRSPRRWLGGGPLSGLRVAHGSGQTRPPASARAAFAATPFHPPDKAARAAPAQAKRPASWLRPADRRTVQQRPNRTKPGPAHLPGSARPSLQGCGR